MPRSRSATVSRAALLAALVLLPAAEAADAQTRTVEVRASATILAHLEPDTPTDLDFGTVWVTEAPTAEPRRLGEFRFSHNSDVRVTAPALPGVLTGPAGRTIPVTFLCALSREPDGGTDPVPCNALGRALIDAPGSVQDSWVVISGTIPAGVRVDETGRYDARLEFVLEAIY